MKNKLFLISIIIIVCSIYLVGALGSNANKNNIFTRFKLQVFEDGKPTKFFIVGDLTIYEDAGTFKVVWTDVWISPLESEKKMLLKPESNSVDDGSIKNVIVRDDHFSFEIVLEPERVMKISGTKLNNKYDYLIEGVGLWWIDLVKSNIKTEWKSVNVPIVLPYTELF
jgi:hypothetical protein